MALESDWGDHALPLSCARASASSADLSCLAMDAQCTSPDSVSTSLPACPSNPPGTDGPPTNALASASSLGEGGPGLDASPTRANSGPRHLEASA